MKLRGSCMDGRSRHTCLLFCGCIVFALFELYSCCCVYGFLESVIRKYLKQPSWLSWKSKMLQRHEEYSETKSEPHSLELHFSGSDSIPLAWIYFSLLRSYIFISYWERQMARPIFLEMKLRFSMFVLFKFVFYYVHLNRLIFYV